MRSIVGEESRGEESRGVRSIGGRVERQWRLTERS